MQTAVGIDHGATSTVASRFTLICGDSLYKLKDIPSASVDMCLTSPPYWGHREYDTSGIGLEVSHEQYIRNLCLILNEVKRTLKAGGSLWLNLGDTYEGKVLKGIPWRVALRMTDEHGWLLRNDVIWNKVKGGLDNSKDKLRNVHEHLFHFVLDKKYFYDTDAIRSAPRKSSVVNGSVISATGVTGIRYKRQIELSTSLSPLEKVNAINELTTVLKNIHDQKLSDFRMIIRGQQRTTHSNSEKVSGRAKELASKGFYFLKYHPNGSKPADVWDIVPEDTHGRQDHFAPFPKDLCRLPILATSPIGGTVLDPFCGTGTTLSVAKSLGRNGIGIDISSNYIETTRSRLSDLYTAIT